MIYLMNSYQWSRAITALFKHYSGEKDMIVHVSFYDNESEFVTFESGQFTYLGG